MPERQEHFPALARRAGGAVPFALSIASQPPVGTTFRQRRGWIEATGMASADRHLPGMAGASVQGGIHSVSAEVALLPLICVKSDSRTCD
ncbi:hypothetical protein C7I36_04605 [Zobellella taiwanensis]|uniref:Uncharacterized protein n=1 Tax=Zobellella taiwanensis TaxID=347535 RepID=A0A2P7R733_9GAMM|nr:hypothetical protein C7I36_04605 [Zobellella taiwanensis]